VQLPFRPHGTELKAFSSSGSLAVAPDGAVHPYAFAPMEAALLDRLADLAVGFGANVQRDQIVTIEAEVGMEPIVRATAERAYKAGARYVDVTYWDAYVKRARLEHAAEETLDFVPSWLGERMTALGDQHAARIIFVPRMSPGILSGIDPARAGRDHLPDLKERLKVVNDRTSNWSVIPYPTEPWARVIHLELDGQALEKLTEELAYVCRLDAEDPAGAWRTRMQTLDSSAGRLTERRFDAIRFEGPGTDLTLGLLPTSKWEAALMTTVDGIEHAPNLPTEEVFTAPDPTRADGVVRATKPLELSGTVIEGLTVRFEGGRAVQIDAERGAEVLRDWVQIDEGAARLGEVALVDREGRIGPLGTVFLNTLLDENAASHIALGSAYELSVGEEDLPRINHSDIHVDFMIGGNEVQVTGLTAEGDAVPVLRDGAWQI
jgi:aminopeptidase